MGQTEARTIDVEIGLGRSVDLRASLAPFGRWGDDLLDRWDGSVLRRTARVGLRRKVVAYAARAHDAADASRLTVSVAAAAAANASDVAVQARGCFLSDATALIELAATDEHVARLAGLYPGVVPVLVSDPFSALIRAISAQQVNLAWAATIRSRLAQRYGRTHDVGRQRVWSLDVKALASATVGHLRDVQLTGTKARSVIACAQAELDGYLEPPRLAAMEDEQLLAHLVALPGIGRWSAEWFLARTLGRPRVVAGDLGVRKAVGRLYGIEAAPAEAEVRLLTAHWGPASTHAQALALHDLAVASGVA